MSVAAIPSFSFCKPANSAERKTKLKTFEEFHGDNLMRSFFENSQKTVATDYVLGLFAHASSNRSLRIEYLDIAKNETKAFNAQFRRKRPNPLQIIAAATHQTNKNQTEFKTLKGHSVLVSGSELNDRSIATLECLIPWFFTKAAYDKTVLSLDDAIRLCANRQDYLETFLHLLLLERIEIHVSKDGGSKIILNKDRLFRIEKKCDVHPEFLDAPLEEICQNEKFQFRNGDTVCQRLMEIAGLYHIQIDGFALHKLWKLSQLKAEQGFSLEEPTRYIHTRNTTTLIHPNSRLGKYLGNAGRRAAAALNAYAPYVDKREKFQVFEDSKLFPIKEFNFETLCRIAGRASDFKKYNHDRLSSWLSPLSRYIGNLYISANHITVFYRHTAKLNSQLGDAIYNYCSKYIDVIKNVGHRGIATESRPTSGDKRSDTGGLEKIHQHLQRHGFGEKPPEIERTTSGGSSLTPGDKPEVNPSDTKPSSDSNSQGKPSRQITVKSCSRKSKAALSELDINNYIKSLLDPVPNPVMGIDSYLKMPMQIKKKQIPTLEKRYQEATNGAELPEIGA